MLQRTYIFYRHKTHEFSSLSCGTERLITVVFVHRSVLKFGVVVERDNDRTCGKRDGARRTAVRAQGRGTGSRADETSRHGARSWDLPLTVRILLRFLACVWILYYSLWILYLLKKTHRKKVSDIDLNYFLIISVSIRRKLVMLLF